jgi:beta-apo-4'-carotenal oxygenase
MPLGGIGQSGMGSYRGRASLDCFSYRRALTTVPPSGPSPFVAMYPPYEGKVADVSPIE